MREILFRGKKIDNGEQKGQFVYGNYVEYGNLQSVIIEKGKYGENYSHEVDKSTVSLCTGLTDKNGKKIFEQDILLAKSKYDISTYKFIVKFGKCGGVQNVLHDVGYLGFYFEIMIPKPENDYGIRNDPLYWLNSIDCEVEVVGNIYENTELLEGYDTK